MGVERALFCAAVAIGLLVYWWRQADKAVYKKMVSDFEHDFPGQCIVCSYHAYGIREFGRPLVPPDDHRCAEKWERWKGMLHTRRDTE